MEPIASSGAGAVFRPAAGASTELAALLRHGRVLSAEVLSSPAEGTLLLAIGRHSIPAESELRLDPGSRFLVRVEETGAGVVLKALAPAEEGGAALIAALRARVGERCALGEALGALRGVLASAPRTGALQALAEQLLVQLAPPAGDGGALRALHESLGLGHEAGLAALLGARAGRAAFARLRQDLKALLLGAERACEGGEHGALREAVARALASLELEQLLNLARERSGDPLVISFPFPEGERWTTARLLVLPDEGGDEAAGRDAEAPVRVTLALELARLGPLRADLALGRACLSLRILVTGADAARRIELELDRLRERLDARGRALELCVRVAAPSEVASALHPLDIRYLHEHRLMSVAG